MLLYQRFDFSTSLLFILLAVWLPTNGVDASRNYPCAFVDTVNITEGLRLKDGSYSYQGLVVPANMTADYNFKVVDGVQENTPKHMRGCVCRQRPCITFCCPFDMRLDQEHHVCVPVEATSAQHTQQAHVEVNTRYGTDKVVNVREAFITKFEIGCWKKYINKGNADFWKWELFENGTLWSNGRLWSPDDYCFTPLQHKEVWSLVPLTCEHSQRGFRLWLYVICMVAAILINLFMFALLLSVKEVRNGGYGETLILYLVFLVIGLSGLVYLAIKDRLKLSDAACRNIGFITYIFIILAFLMLSFLSWKFWYNFRSKRLSGWRRQVFYVFAIMLAVGLQFLVRLVQDSNITQKLKPGIGETFCWFDTRLWGIFLYYYIPILVCLAFGAVFCIRTYFVIWDLPTDTLSVAGYDLELQKAHFHTFCAYLLGTTCVWAREIIVFVTIRVRGHFLIIDFWSGIFHLGLAVAGFIFLVYQNRVLKSWWRLNVSKQPNVDDIYMARVYPSEYARTEKLKEGYKDEIREEDIALKGN